MTWGGRSLYAVPFVWLTLFLLLPFVFIFEISLASAVEAVPPYAPVLDWRPGEGVVVSASIGNYRFLLEDSLYLASYLSSLRMAFLATVACLLLGYPIAYAIAQARGSSRVVLLMLAILPFWTSFLIRIYAWKVLLQAGGPVNATLMWLGIVDQPLAILYTDFAVYVGIVYSYLPFMVLPVYAAIARLDGTLVEASLDLGGRPWRTFATVTLPLSMPGVLAGCLLVFVPVVGEFVVPELLGGSDNLMVGRVLWNEFFANRDWPLACAVAMVMLVLLVLPIMLLQRGWIDR